LGIISILIGKTTNNRTKMKVYYAHFMGIYDTPAEDRDIKTLEDLGLEVFNPNTSKIQKEVKVHLEEDGRYDAMFEDVFFKRVRECEIFAFRALPDGRIPGGVYMELKVALTEKKLIIELPCGMHSRGMGKDDTREYLKNIGQR